jgi:hypothetical protein
MFDTIPTTESYGSSVGPVVWIQKQSMFSRMATSIRFAWRWLVSGDEGQQILLATRNTMQLTLVNAGRIVSHEVLHHPFATVAVSGNYRDLEDRPALTRFAISGNVTDIEPADRAILNPILARGTVLCESDIAIIHHDVGSLDYVMVATVVGSGGRVWVESKTINTAVVRIADKQNDEQVYVDWAILAR